MDETTRRAAQGLARSSDELADVITIMQLIDLQHARLASIRVLVVTGEYNRATNAASRFMEIGDDLAAVLALAADVHGDQPPL